MSRFHRLPVARVDRETRDAVAITFDVPAALAREFRYADRKSTRLNSSH